MTTRTLPIAIIGGGIAGSALAIFLKKAGRNCEIFEATQGEAPAGGGLQIAPNGMKVLELLGLRDEFLTHGSPTTGMAFHNHSGKLLCAIDDQKPGSDWSFAVNSSRKAVHEMLLARAHALGVPVHFGKKLTGLNETAAGVTCRFGDGSEREALAVIGADGIGSQVRSLILKKAPRPAYTGLLNLGGFIAASKLPQGKLPPADRLEMVFGLEGFFGYGFCDAARTRLMWWSAIPGPEFPRAQLQAMSDEDKRALLMKVHAGWCAPVETIIQGSDPEIFAGNIYDIPRLPTWHQGRVCLIGDAAHAVSPHSGQGASMALEDAAYLARCLLRDAAAPEAAFQAFEDGRRKRAEKVVAMGRRSGNQKRKLGPLGARFRDWFVARMLPRFSRQMNHELYAYRVEVG